MHYIQRRKEENETVASITVRGPLVKQIAITFVIMLQPSLGEVVESAICHNTVIDHNLHPHY